ncbi:CRE-SRD-33 protein [Caenorhabditis remanei]|uniref:CRE-SRD-33 protein n=1 Tax=Caenorhabditis remanei TaxID=31234 RepID=E3LK25_CAERE|nr:CRE-SRD-33 protein [Caenorhabditis remanei]
MSFWRTVAAVVAPFTSDTYMNTADSLFVIIVTLLTAIGFCLNLLLLFLIIWKSPRSLTPYRIFLANTTITQLLFALFSITSQPRVLSKHQYTIVIYLGPVQYFGEWFSYMSYVGILHLSLNSFISLMLSMIYRFFSIRFHRFSMNVSLILCIIGYSIPFLIYASCSHIVTSSSISVNKAILDGLVENLESYHMVVSTNISNQLPLIILILAVTFGLIPIYFVMYWCRHQIHKTLKQTRSVHSPSTRDNARRLVHALTIQSIIPLVSVFPASTFWCLSQLGIVEPTAYSYFIIPCLSLGCIADPLVTIRCVLPYRRWILKLCHRTNSDMTTSNQDKSTIFQRN